MSALYRCPDCGSEDRFVSEQDQNPTCDACLSFEKHITPMELVEDNDV